ncbi:DAR GTPase 2, mitochondrial-like isoform X3 [Euphorbia lathyris]|uniref:DAR GTPase 2, mitochondrial-like isoform X3 n=1 Tax=Euphorbia lathyris TaxID=212925 RepID=UPI003313BD0E
MNRLFPLNNSSPPSILFCNSKNLRLQEQISKYGSDSSPPSILLCNSKNLRLQERVSKHGSGAIRDFLVGEKELAQYFLAILNLSDEYKKWAKLSTHGNNISYIDHKEKCSNEGHSGMKRKTLTDHTQDIVVDEVRRILYETISCFDGKVQNGVGMEQLIKMQFTPILVLKNLTLCWKKAR